jgi:hypothetical protein
LRSKKLLPSNMTADDYADALVTVSGRARDPAAAMLMRGAPTTAAQLTRCVEHLQVGFWFWLLDNGVSLIGAWDRSLRSMYNHTHTSVTQIVGMWAPTLRMLFKSRTLQLYDGDEEDVLTLFDGELAVSAAVGGESSSLRSLVMEARTVGAAGPTCSQPLLSALAALRTAGSGDGKAQALVSFGVTRLARSLCAEASPSRRTYLAGAGLEASADNLARLDKQARRVLAHLGEAYSPLEQNSAPAAYAEALVTQDERQEWGAALRFEAYAGVAASAAASWACYAGSTQSESERATRTSLMIKA